MSWDCPFREILSCFVYLYICKKNFSVILFQPEENNECLAFVSERVLGKQLLTINST